MPSSNGSNGEKETALSFPMAILCRRVDDLLGRTLRSRAESGQLIGVARWLRGRSNPRHRRATVARPPSSQLLVFFFIPLATTTRAHPTPPTHLPLPNCTQCTTERRRESEAGGMGGGGRSINTPFLISIVGSFLPSLMNQSRQILYQ